MKAGFDKVDNTLSRLFQRLDDQIDGRDV
jgi:hypothetical protein